MNNDQRKIARMKSLLAIAFALLCHQCRAAETIRILAWNIESGGSETTVITDQLKTQMPKYDILALCSAPPSIQRSPFFQERRTFQGSHGGNNRILVSSTKTYKFSHQTEWLKIGDKTIPEGSRPPVAVKFKHQNSRREFILLVNHFSAENADVRDRQAEFLVELARTASLPIVAVGDFNMDYDIKSGRGNEAFDIIQADGIWRWIKPERAIDTNWSDLDGNGKDDNPNTVSDLVFVAGPWEEVRVTCEVVVREGDFPDDKKTSDHRPVLVTIEQ